MAAVCLSDASSISHDHLIPRPRAHGVGPPPRIPRCAAGSPRRPFCRIFPEGRIWVLELSTEFSFSAQDRVIPKRLVFATLGAAISHAVANDYRYKVIHPQPAPDGAPFVDRRPTLTIERRTN